ncbi:MAG: Nif3-like dinuclear metal center hexameric protein [Lachnospiraceae bacterium]
MECVKIIQWLEALSPANFAMSWDNVGLLLGRRDKQVKSVLLCVDVDDEVVLKARAENVDMIVSHHPLVFSGLKKITTDDFIGKRVLSLAQADICVYAMHTNFDVMGMADAAAERLKLLDKKVLQVTYEDDIATEGIGRSGKLIQAMSLEELAIFVKESFDVEAVKVFGDKKLQCCEVAVCPGSGKSLVEDVLKAGVDVYITGDIDHHTGIDLVAQGVAVIDAGHYGIEKIFVPYMKDYFNKMMPHVMVMQAEDQTPFWKV